MKVSRPSTPAAGSTAGSTTFQNVRSVEQPSTRAASMSSSGTALDDVLPHHEHAEGAGEERDVTAHRVSNQSRSTIIPHSGMRPSWVGTIIVTRTVSSSALRPLNLSLANANPASVEVTTTLTVTDDDTMTELIMP